MNLNTFSCLSSRLISATFLIVGWMQFSAGALGSQPQVDYRISLNGEAPGRIFDGVGGVSAGGSSRLLVDYPEPQRSQVLDFLFKPRYGAALQLLKVEIGADADSTAGSEPSHMRSPAEVDCGRGYEWWLMREAKARNPNIKLCALAWGTAGWIQGGFWYEENIQYTLAWLDCAKRKGLTIDYLGGGNERGWNADYYIKLARALKEYGYGHIKVVSTDDHNPPDYWAVASEMMTNAAFAHAVDVLGEHDVCVWRTLQKHCHVSPDALKIGKPLWDSENSTQDYLVGYEPLARVMNRHYIDGRITGNFNWALVGAYYANFPAPGTGLILADRPWSGYYDIGPAVWVDAHTTQFTAPGWRYLDSACGYTTHGASFVALRSPNTSDYTLVIETMDLFFPEVVEITVGEGLFAGRVHLWSSNLRSQTNEDDFRHIGTFKPSAGSYTLKLKPGCIYTLSTTTGQRKGHVRTQSNRAEQLALPFVEDFENVGADRMARFFADVHGAFEAAPSGGGRAGTSYRQVVAREPVLWHNQKMPPTTIVGDPTWWGDYEVSADALLEEAGYVELLGRVESQQHTVLGYHLQVANTGAWQLYVGDAPDKVRILASGNQPYFSSNVWHRLGLRFHGKQIVALLDGTELAVAQDGTHSTGQVGFRVSPWQHAQFDNLRVESVGAQPQLIPHADMRVSATSQHAENDFGAIHLARNAIDDRIETTWRSEYTPAAPLPQSITLALKRRRTVQALLYKPTTVGTQGAITRYAIRASLDGRSFEQIAAGTWEPTMATKVAAWPKRKVRFIQLEALEASGNAAKGVSASEINLSCTPVGLPVQ